MGASNSKTTPDASSHVFSASSPVSFSQSVIDSLQNSPDTDSSRAQHNELLIQSRVTSELEKIRDEESSRLAEMTASLTPSEEAEDPSSTDSLKDKISSALGRESKDQSHDSVQKEIATLKAKLEKRKTVEKADKGVEKAKGELVQCLRMNDRRPLDCWEQVEGFKREVAKMEQRFVERAMR